MYSRRSFVKKTGLLSSLALFLDVRKLFALVNEKVNIINLAGTWGIKLDPENKGIDEQWYLSTFSNFLHLPGSLQAQGYGDNVTENTKWWSGAITGLWKLSPIYAKYRQPDNIKIFEWLQPDKHYIGTAWYSKEFIVPQHWSGKRIKLSLERVHWVSQLYVNGRHIGSSMRLGTPHEFDIGEACHTGKNRLVIKIDNSRVVDLGDNAHSVSDQTQTAWNGMVGNMAVSCCPDVEIAHVEVYPDIARKKIKIQLTIANHKKLNAVAILQIHAQSYNVPKETVLPVLKKSIHLKGSDVYEELEYDMGANPSLWDEFTPALYKLFVNIEVGAKGIGESKTITFGMREIRCEGRKILLNNKSIYLRGNVDCAVFPFNGYPEMEVDWWKHTWKIHKAWGFNHVRFHSWCPPKAAFIAADEIGVFLQPEAGEWAVINKQEQVDFLHQEAEAMLKTYGNHPSFMMMSLGNELRTTAAILKQFIVNWQKDNRRLYSGKINGQPIIAEFDFYCSRQSPGKNRLRYVNGWPPTPAISWFYEREPSTHIKFEQAVLDYPKPILAHETGQRCVYPDVVNQPQKFTGSLKAAYLTIAKEQLQERGMLNQVKDFVLASGLWQNELYKEEFEAGFRTEGLAGFQFLSLVDFPGQQTAPVGVLDYFYHTKGHITAPQFRKFCHHTVILAEMKKRTWFTNETFSFELKLSNFSGHNIAAAELQMQMNSATDAVFHYPITKIPLAKQGSLTDIGHFEWTLNSIKKAGKYTLSVKLKISDNETIVNDWSFWVYPAEIPQIDESGIYIVQKFDENVADKLKNGATVLLLPRQQDLKGNLGPCFASFYWTAMGLNGGESSAGGLLTNPEHPVFKYFPTDFHSNWQWWELLTKASPMILDEFEAENPWPLTYNPLVQMVPSWKLNRKLAVLAEAKVGNGKLMICSMDISTNLSERKVAAWFRYSLLCYLKSNRFNPQTQLTTAMVKSVFTSGTQNNLALLQAKITVSSQQPQHPALNMIDGKKQTYWSSAIAQNKQAQWVEIDLKKEFLLKGIKYTPVEKATNAQRVNDFKVYGGAQHQQKLLLTGTMPNSNETIELLFDKNYPVRYLKFEASPKQDMVAIAELDIIPADTLPFEG